MRESSLFCDMEPTHDFFLFNKKLDTFSALHKAGQNFNKVSFDDDFLNYIKDSLHWITVSQGLSENAEKTNGLNMTGISVIDKKSARKLKAILDGWIALFSEAPSMISLTTGCKAATEFQPGEIIRQAFHKRELLRSLVRLSEFCAQVNANSKLCIVHLGL